ncbi:MAG: thiamine biosynthesis protein ThiS [Variovorax paradoxus]|nr:MAG: thiamine biosynthesis protein ThiS [Variovorax paradoxus]PZQ05083.1 MAG: thiamine biosynthesis protein ThiS [Variovorax paradoxus]
MTTDTVSIVLDGQPHALAAGSTLAALVDALGHRPEAVGTAVNGVFVARGHRHDVALHAGDAVVLFQPITGG